jgi:hypothetical protein
MNLLLRNAIVVVCGLCAACAVQAWADEWTTLEGTTARGQIAAIGADGQVTGEGVPSGLKLDGLRAITREVAPVAGAEVLVVELVGGGRIRGASLAMADEKFQIGWALGDKVSLPIDVVRSVRFRPGVVSTEFDAALAKPSADNDRLFVEVDGQIAMLTGLIESITPETVAFQYEGKQQSLPSGKLFGLVMAQVGVAGRASSGVTVELADGSRVAGIARELADGQLSVGVGPASVSLPWSAVKRVSVRSSRLAYLSDLDPIEVEEYRLVTLPQPWQRDKSVGRKTLTIGEQKFDRGLGVHAYSRLVFDVGGDYDQFLAVIGIDAAADRRGDCVFVVVGDGRELARERMTGAMPGKALTLEIAGVKRLSLIVEPGAELDLADLANWADARVVKKK